MSISKQTVQTNSVITDEQTAPATADNEAALIDQEIFFGPSMPKVDFNHWSKMALWSLKEAKLITMGLDPAYNYKPPRSFDQKASPLMGRYDKLSELIERAYKAKELKNPLCPVEYYAWAKRHDIDLPPILEKLLIPRSKDKGLEEPQQTKESKLDPRERETLLKLIIGMAIDFYGYDPKASKSPIPKELEGILDRQGLPISDDTIRKWLKEASKLLSSEDSLV